MGLYATLLSLEYFQGRPGFRFQYELFLFVFFGIVLTWFAFFGGFVSDVKQRMRIQNEKVQKAHEEIKIEVEERKRAEDEREKLQEQLLQSRKMEAIGSLAGGIAHEFNNILGTIIGNTELALNDVPVEREHEARQDRREDEKEHRAQIETRQDRPTPAAHVFGFL